MPTEAQVLVIDGVKDHEIKRCTNCRRPKPLDEFGPNPKAGDGRKCWCLRCNRLAEYSRYHEGGGKEAKATYKARPEVLERDRNWKARHRRQCSAANAAYRATPKGRAAHRRANAAYHLKRATTEEQRARCLRLIAEYTAIIAKLDERARAEAELELPREPIPPADDCDFRGVHRNRHGTFTVMVSVPGKGQVYGGSYATKEEARTAANRVGKEQLGVENYAVPKWRRKTREVAS